MVAAVDPAEELDLFAGLLRGGFSAQTIAPERQSELVLRGIVAVLEEWIDEAADQAAAAAELLREASRPHGGSLPDAVRAQAYQALVRLSVEGRIPALDALFRLAVEDDLPAARQVIATRGLHPGCPLLRPLFDWFTAIENAQTFPESALSLLSESYFNEASPALRKRLLATAPAVGMQNWARIVSAVESADDRLLDDLVDRYPSFTDAERALSLDLLDEHARNEQAWAREALFALYLRREEERARQQIDSAGYLPEDSEERALYLFLAGEWDRYNALDFDHRLLSAAYENADRTLRRQLLEHSRHTGQTEWLRESEAAAASTAPIRWLSDLTDADWQIAIDRLNEAQNHAALWQLAQVASPVWSAAILTRLAQCNWQPESAEEREAFTILHRLAQESSASPLALRPRSAIHPPGEVTCLALQAGGQRIAAGSTDQRIFIWDLVASPTNDAIARTPISAPVPVTRALAFDPSGEHLAAASGDHRIRVFRLKGGQMLKTLEGHQGMIRALAVSPDSRMLYSAGFDGSARAWRFPAGPMLRQVQHGGSAIGSGGEIFTMALGSGGTHLLTGGGDGIVRAWALPDFTAARQLLVPVSDRTGTVTHLAASPTSDLVASVTRENGSDGTIRLWNFISGGLLRSFPNTGAPLTSLCLHPNDQILIGGHSDGAISLWSLSTGQVLERMTGHTHPVSGLALAPGGERLYSAPAGEGAIYAWDLSTILAIRLAADPQKPGMAAAVQEQARASGGSAAERRWMTFAAELARWRQRFDIELADFEPIRLGEFDIEL